jgi:DNA-directed RNA polymerase specialized sigma subunit
LTSNQINQVNNLIKSNKLSLVERSKINKIMYVCYEKWAIKKAIDFKNFHKYKCKNIDTSELILSSKFGLFKSIEKYNGKSPFIYFSEFYIKGELLRTLTNSLTLSSIDKKIRIKNKSNLSQDELTKYKQNLKPLLVSYNENWKFDKMYKPDQDNILNSVIKKEEKGEKNIHIWSKVNKLNSFSKRVFHLKFDEEFNKIRSNKHISILMCCSEENIRINLLDSLKIILNSS